MSDINAVQAVADSKNIVIQDQFKFMWDGTSDKYRYLVLQGGAGSGKSKAICQRLVYMFLEYPDINIYVVRASNPVLQRSVFMGKDPSIYEELNIWGCPAKEWLNMTRRTITNPSNGSMFTFVGLDDPEKIKSVNANYVWIEEATELNVDKFNQLNLRLRRDNPVEGKINQMFISYNPISYNNWVIRTFQTNVLPERESQIYRSFTNFSQNKFVKLDSVKDWLTTAQTDYSFYQTYVLGIPGIPLGQIYRNITFQSSIEWSQEVWDTKPYYGIDWGFIDPMVLVECRDVRKESGEKWTYVRCLYYETEKHTSDLIAYMRQLGITSAYDIYYDNAEADRGNELLKAGFSAHKAIKNIKAGISHVQGCKIVFDDSGKYGDMGAKEIVGYTWKKDPANQDKYIDEPIDENNHACDAMRYALFTRHMRDADAIVVGMDLNGKHGEGIDPFAFDPASLSGCDKRYYRPVKN